jgi:ABC-type multidrug transport system ATPase subunit
MYSIQKILGYCPQHDILWEELTPEEHLEIYSVFKGIPNEKQNSLIQDTLNEVELSKVRNQLVSTFSGGMKRRVSLAISCIGNPKIIFLDEPTTGLDPLTRLGIWKLIENMKKNRVIVLTTHSMFEADALSDRIAIMKNGQLKCIGNSIYLKNQYGKGYYINIITKNVEQVKKFVMEHLKDSTLLLETSGSLKFLISDKRNIPQFFESLESQSSDFVEDWSLNHTSLEDVFFKIVKD